MKRRKFLLGTTVAAATFAAPTPYAGEPVSLAAEPAINLTAAAQEKHSIFLLLAMKLVRDHWCIEKQYPDVREAYSKAFPGREFREYGGHNVGCIVVNARDEIVCFATNRNYRFNSTLEHAEARAIRRSIEIENDRRFRRGDSLEGLGAMLAGFRAYTTLESCAQCSGILQLANIQAVAYAQDDLGQHKIGNILYNLNSDASGLGAPLPIRAKFFEFFPILEAAYRSATSVNRIGTTSFLKLVEAFKIFEAAAERFNTYQVAHGENLWVLDHAREFARGYSATPQEDAL